MTGARPGAPVAGRVLRPGVAGAIALNVAEIPGLAGLDRLVAESADSPASSDDRGKCPPQALMGGVVFVPARQGSNVADLA